MSELLIAIVLILLPGIIATIISDKLTSHSKWDPFKFGLYALVLGVVSYVLLQILVYGYNILKAFSISAVNWQHLNIWGSALNGGRNIEPWELCVAFLLSVPVAFFASWLINYKLFNKLAQKLGVSNKFGDENLFSYYLNAHEIDWVYLREPARGLTYQGRIVSFSENEKIHEIVLSNVSVYGESDGSMQLLYKLPTMYICKECGQLTIEAIPAEYLGEDSSD